MQPEFNRLEDKRGQPNGVGKFFSPPAGMPEINHVTFLLTNRCNFKCGFCLSRTKKERKADLSTEAVRHSIQALGGKAAVRFSGGEPSLHPDFWRLVEYAASKGPVEILTNGSWISEDQRELKKLFSPLLKSPNGNLLKNIQFQISADPEHFECDPRLKAKLLAFRKFLKKHKSYALGPEDLRINVRGQHWPAVYKYLNEPQPGAMRGFFRGMVFLPEIPFSRSLIGDSKSLVSAGGAKNLGKGIPGRGPRESYLLHEFSAAKDLDESARSPTMTINPHGNAFVSVYSAYENNTDPEFTVGRLGNLYKQGMYRLVRKMYARQGVWREFLEKQEHPYNLARPSDLMGGSGFSKDLRGRFREHIRDENRERREFRETLKKLADGIIGSMKK